MIVVQGDFVMKAGTREQAVASFIAAAKGTQQEAGCIRYNFYADLEDPNKFVVYEEWESLEALQVHLSRENPPPHMVVFREVQGSIRESAAVNFMQAERVQT
jgi:quinol monooxygenase YgiN